MNLMFIRSSAATLALCVAAIAQDAAPGAPKLPNLAKGVKIMAAGAPIDVTTGHAAPLVLDWNKDGKKDLWVGEYGNQGGKVRIYLNKGTDSAPVFDEFSILQAGGADAVMPSS